MNDTAYVCLEIDRAMLLIDRVGIFSSPPNLLTVSSEGPIYALLFSITSLSYDEARKHAIERYADGWMFEELRSRFPPEDL